MEGKKRTPYSIHTFMWPFKWAGGTMGEFGQKLTVNTKWKDSPFEIKESKHYNEYVYFHSHVRDSLFANNASNKDTVRYFEYTLEDDATFEFEIVLTSPKQMQLQIKGISLHLFFSGVGTLTFQLENNKHLAVEDIQLINDFGRRTYPQFLDVDMKTKMTKEAFLPNWLKVSYNPNVEEKFSYYETIQGAIGDSIIQPPAHIKALFNDGFVFSDKASLDDKEIVITHLTDDRMFTLCWLGDESLSTKMKDHLEENKEYVYEHSKEWYKLMFCDSKNLTCQSDVMLKDHIKQYTYDRWVNYGTLYGITRDCLFCLTNRNDIPLTVVLPHMQSMYYQMTILCLAQRASIQKFSNDLSEINFFEVDSIVKEQAFHLQKNYLKFNNKLYFKEVTDHIQGIEIYQMMQQAMNIENVASQLDREIEELHNLLNMEESLQMSKNANTLTKIATYAVPASLVMALFALFSGDIDFSKDIAWGRFWSIALLVVLSVIVMLLGKTITNKILKRR